MIFVKPKDQSTQLFDLQHGQPSTVGGPDIVPWKPIANVSVLRTSNTQNGGLFQKMRVGYCERSRISTTGACNDTILTTIERQGQMLLVGAEPVMPRTPPPCPTDHLRASLLTAFHGEQKGANLSMLPSYITDLPNRLGYSSTLDSAVACLLDVHSAIFQEPEGSDRINPRHYLKALQGLQSALQDPEESLSSNTLCAITILGWVEALGAAESSLNYVNHCGGAARLIELRGPCRHYDSFERKLLHGQRGTIVRLVL